jgi:hypothetical protein
MHMSAHIIEYRRIHHAAHEYMTGKPLHDLSEWTVDGDRYTRPQIDRAEYHSGHLRDGRQVSIWTRCETPSPERCTRCPKDYAP